MYNKEENIEDIKEGFVVYRYFKCRFIYITVIFLIKMFLDP